MQHLILCVCSAFVLSSCVRVQESLPAWKVESVSFDDLPRPVQAAFHRDFAEARVTRIEQSTSISSMSGHPKKYRVFYGNPGAEGYRVIYDETGKRENASFDSWFSSVRAPAEVSARR
jgi:hypothetical protein